MTAGGNCGWPSAEGVVYTGAKLGLQHQNKLLYADFSKNWTKELTCTSGYSSCGSEETFMTDVGGTTRLAQGPDGNLYAVSNTDNVIYKISRRLP